MRTVATLVTSLSLGLTLAISAPALAQGTPAPAQLNLAPATIVYDSEGAELGKISSVEGGNVVVDLGGRLATLPGNAFMQTAKGPAITITLAQLTAALDQQAAAEAATLEAAFKPGAEVRGVRGTAVVGTVKLTDAEGVVLTTSGGDVRLPRKAFFLAQSGLATSFTADQFAAAVAETNAASADANAEPAAGKPAN